MQFAGGRGWWQRCEGLGSCGGGQQVDHTDTGEDGDTQKHQEEGDANIIPKYLTFFSFCLLTLSDLLQPILGLGWIYNRNR